MSDPSSARPRVAIIVLNYQGRDCLLSCLRSLGRLTYPEKDIIVVDNASSDGSLTQAQAQFPEALYLPLSENLGFAGGMNAGLRQALTGKAQYFWLFNNDAEAEPECLARLVEEAERHPESGLLSPLILEKNGEKIWFGGARINSLRMRVEHVPQPSFVRSKEAYTSEILTGCALLIRRSALEKVGFLDERFFLYYEDADYSERMKRAGLGRLVVPLAQVRHSEASRQNEKKVYHLVFSGLLFFAKHSPKRERLYFSLYVTIRRIKNALDRLRGQKDSLLVARAYQDFYGKYRNSPFLFPHLR